MDSDCTRSNRDCTHRYVVPTTPASIPLQTQLWLFDQMADLAACELSELFMSHSDEILEMARIRMAAGYASYGSRMFGWPPERRRRELLEELADAIVYFCSGALE